jgi:hypothetical protein
MGKNIIKEEDGFYHVDDKQFKKLVGTRAEVMHGTAYKTSGGLTNSKLSYSKSGRIVSAVKQQSAKKEQRLKKYGYTAKKGHFGPVKISNTRKTKTVKRKKRKMCP